MVVRKPDFFLVGAPRCGTESMKLYLSSHHDIFIPKNELYFFSTDLIITPISYSLSFDEYISIFKERKEKFLGDKTTWYLYSRVAAKKIKEFRQDAKIIIMLRNPVEAVYSKYLLSYYSGYEWLPFEEALRAEDLRKQGKLIRLVQFVDFYFYKSLYMYYEQVKRYFEVFPREQIKVLIHDDYVMDRKKVVYDVLEFIGADVSLFNQDILKKEINVSRIPKSRIVNLIRYFVFLYFPFYIRKAKKIYPLFFFLRLLSAGLAFSYLILEKYLITTDKPALPEHLISYLKNYFREDVEKLSELLGRDLTHWVK